MWRIAGRVNTIEPRQSPSASKNGAATAVAPSIRSPWLNDPSTGLVLGGQLQQALDVGDRAVGELLQLGCLQDRASLILRHAEEDRPTGRACVQVGG